MRIKNALLQLRKPNSKNQLKKAQIKCKKKDYELKGNNKRRFMVQHVMSL
jgi:hypothetical protein